MAEFSPEIPPPGWVTSGAKLTRGLDIVGLRLPVQNIGSTLLDGITTVTPTVRYLGLRTWVARRYALAKLPNDATSFSAFAGRVEAAVAIGNLLVDSSMPGLVGTDGVNDLPTDLDDYELKRLVDQPAAVIYAGASDQLHLTLSDEGSVPALTNERGLHVYEAVEATLGATAFGRELARDPSAARFSRESLKEVGQAYSMRKVNGAERDALVDAVLPAAPLDAEIPRVGTYALLLEMGQRLERAPTKAEVLRIAIAAEAGLDSCYQPCLDGWARFLVRDMLAVTHEAVLAAVTNELERRSRSGLSLDADETITALLEREDELVQPLKALGALPTHGSSRDWTLADVESSLTEAQGKVTEGPVRRWTGTIDEEEVIGEALPTGAGALALLPLAWLLVRARITATLGTHLGVRGLSREGRLGVKQVVLPRVESALGGKATFHEFARDLAWRTVQQHLSIAWSRLAADPRSDVSCISADGNRWSPRRPFKQGRTAARLTRAIGWIEQLGLVGKRDSAEANRAKKILERVRPLLAKAQGDR